MLAINPAFETPPDSQSDEAHDEELAAAASRLPSDILATLKPAQVRRLAMLIAPDKAEHRVYYQISAPALGSRYYFALFFGREKRTDQRLELEGQKRSLVALLIRFTMALWLLSSAVVTLTLIGIFVLYALKSVLGIDLFDGHFFLHPLLFKLGLLPGDGS